MNDPISWDQSLVKKFSSSNHYKLLNQLRNEVKKYPLNNKKKISSIKRNDTKIDKNNKSDDSLKQDCSLTNNSNQPKDLNNSKSTVSFNNSKNFSIYNQNLNSSISRGNEIILPNESLSKEDSLSPTFKERLNQIDMK